MTEASKALDEFMKKMSELGVKNLIVCADDPDSDKVLLRNECSNFFRYGAGRMIMIASEEDMKDNITEDSV